VKGKLYCCVSFLYLVLTLFARRPIIVNTVHCNWLSSCLLLTLIFLNMVTVTNRSFSCLLEPNSSGRWILWIKWILSNKLRAGEAAAHCICRRLMSVHNRTTSNEVYRFVKLTARYQCDGRNQLQLHGWPLYPSSVERLNYHWVE